MLRGCRSSHPGPAIAPWGPFQPSRVCQRSCQTLNSWHSRQLERVEAPTNADSSSSKRRLEAVERLVRFSVPPAPPDTAGNARRRCLLRASAELDLWIRHVGLPLACVGLVRADLACRSSGHQTLYSWISKQRVLAMHAGCRRPSSLSLSAGTVSSLLQLWCRPSSLEKQLMY